MKFNTALQKIAKENHKRVLVSLQEEIERLESRMDTVKNYSDEEIFNRFTLFYKPVEGEILDPGGGTYIGDVQRNAERLAELTRKPVSFMFNGVKYDIDT